MLIYIIIDLRIEFCKSKSHADRWEEEVKLLQEEMKRVTAFFQTRADHWAANADAVGSTIPVSDSGTAEGLRAFANEQAVLFRAMKTHCNYLWRYVGEYVALGQGEVVPVEAQQVGGDSGW